VSLGFESGCGPEESLASECIEMQRTPIKTLSNLERMFRLYIHLERDYDKPERYDTFTLVDSTEPYSETSATTGTSDFSDESSQSWVSTLNEYSKASCTSRGSTGHNLPPTHPYEELDSFVIYQTSMMSISLLFAEAEPYVLLVLVVRCKMYLRVGLRNLTSTSLLGIDH
jgi:hypothetical protein